MEMISSNYAASQPRRPLFKIRITHMARQEGASRNKMQRKISSMEHTHKGRI
jgi:hypothetical protein